MPAFDTLTLDTDSKTTKRLRQKELSMVANCACWIDVLDAANDFDASNDGASVRHREARRVISADTKFLVSKVQEDADYGLHAARVGGYNASIRGNGEELTVAHGRWRSRAHNRYHRWSDLEVAGITAAMVGEANSYLVDEEAGEGRPFQIRARAVRLNQSPRGSGCGGRTGRGGRGRTGATVVVPEAVAGTGADGSDATVEDEFDVPAGNPHGVPTEEPLASPASSPPRLSPPPNWTVAADGRFMPPPSLPNATPQPGDGCLWRLGRCTGSLRGWRRTSSWTVLLVHARGMAHEAFLLTRIGPSTCGRLGHVPVVSRGLWVRCV